MIFGNTEIVLKKGDITKENVDVIVNAANSSLMGGEGVDGAIHKAGGPSILEECRKIRKERGMCAPGEAVITVAGILPAQHVIHTVGPIWHGGGGGEHDILRLAYTNSMRLAEINGAKSIAFPAISTGVFGYPEDKAAFIAIEAVKKYVCPKSSIEEVRFILFSEDSYEVYVQTLNKINEKL